MLHFIFQTIRQIMVGFGSASSTSEALSLKQGGCFVIKQSIRIAGFILALFALRQYRTEKSAKNYEV